MKWWRNPLFFLPQNRNQFWENGAFQVGKTWNLQLPTHGRGIRVWEMSELNMEKKCQKRVISQSKFQNVAGWIPIFHGKIPICHGKIPMFHGKIPQFFQSPDSVDISSAVALDVVSPPAVLPFAEGREFPHSGGTPFFRFTHQWIGQWEVRWVGNRPRFCHGFEHHSFSMFL